MVDKPKILVFMLAYNAEKTIESMLSRIPESLGEYDTSVLVIDDASTDATTARATEYQANNEFPFPLTILRNPVNLGFGGNAKLGMHYAIENGFDVIGLVHGDGQYPPEKLPEFLPPLIDGTADVVFGSRMMEGFNALKGGMPLYKFIGNKILTRYENWVLGSNLSEFHTGLRMYTIDALKKIPYHLNSNDFDFETEIIIQLLFSGARFKEFPIPTFYGDEVSHVNGLAYAWNIVKQATLGQAQRKWSLCYQRKFDVAPKGHEAQYHIPKVNFTAAHERAVKTVADGSRVLEIGSADAQAGELLRRRQCRVTGLDAAPPPDGDRLDAFVKCDLNELPLPIRMDEFDYVLLLDVIGHLHEPERFLEELHATSTNNPRTTVVITQGNIGFLANRLQLFWGYFNYGKRGILDPSHTRLFTFASLRRLLHEGGFRVVRSEAVIAPFELVFGDGWFPRMLGAVNRALTRISPGMFGYRILMEAQPMPTLSYLLDVAYRAHPGDGVASDVAERQGDPST
ncbi:MAG: glycosyltransferase [Proteobacteria bacterium]|nr:glycosyltransferase [Pseudomonadota bacterium]